MAAKDGDGIVIGWSRCCLHGQLKEGHWKCNGRENCELMVSRSAGKTVRQVATRIKVRLNVARKQEKQCIQMKRMAITTAA